jgi:hypothetical protein
MRDLHLVLALCAVAVVVCFMEPRRVDIIGGLALGYALRLAVEKADQDAP